MNCQPDGAVPPVSNEPFGAPAAGTGACGEVVPPRPADGFTAGGTAVGATQLSANQACSALERYSVPRMRAQSRRSGMDVMVGAIVARVAGGEDDDSPWRAGDALDLTAIPG
jgi:hypothetical protein